MNLSARALNGLMLLLGLLPPLNAAAPEPLISFAARFTTGPNWNPNMPPPAQTGFTEHSANLARLHRAGSIQFGARYGETGLVVVVAANADVARALFASDPSLAAGTFALKLDRFSPFYDGNTTYLQSPEAHVLRSYLAAYNQHDADGVAAHLAENLVWYSIAGDSLRPEATHRTEIRDWLVEHFRAHPTTRSDYLAFEQTGPYVTVRERASSLDPAGKRVGQEAFAIHEIRDGLIRRVWYFPAH
jgi:ketosteroid isomerase-like protein